MTVPVTEFRGNFTDIVAIHELRGSYPEITISSDIDYSALIAGEADPMFITLPIGKANVKSGNGRFYDEAWLQELERQTLATRPIGLMGHLSEAERSHAMPPEAIFWLATARVDDVLWAKGFVPSGPAKERIKRYKASGKSIATSIDAFAEGKWSDALGAYHMNAASMRLNQIDIAPAERAGVADLARVPHITTEMESEALEPEQEPIMAEKDKLTILQELTPDDARLLPKAVRDAILAEQAAPPEVAEVQEMRQALGVDGKANLAALVTEMKQAQETQRQATIRSRITELATAGIKLEAVRGMVTELVAARNPQSVQEAETAYNEVAQSAHVTELLKTQVQTTMGPPQRTPVAAQQGQAKYFQVPQGEGA
jgi:hypothetical protein